MSRHREEARADTRRDLATGLLKLTVSGLLLAYLFSQTDAARIAEHVRRASLWWMAGALALYFAMILVSAWRWGVLLDVQQVTVARLRLVSSYLVATFFNNFLPSNIGGDVVRIRDTAPPAGSKTLATTVVVLDRGIGLLALCFVAALGASVAELAALARMPVGSWAVWLGFGAAMGAAMPLVLAPAGVGRLLHPLRVFHQEWVEERIARLTTALVRFRGRPAALAVCFAGGVVVQMILVGFYVAVAHGLGIAVPWPYLAMIVPASFVIQMVPVSVNGLGVREAAFAYSFTRLGLPLESGLVLSLAGAGLVLLFSLSGAAAYVLRRA